MSQEDLIDAYVSGEISRRTFVRRLAAAGVSLAAAGAYAQLLGTGDAHAARQPPPGSGFYEPVHGGFYDSQKPVPKSGPAQGHPADGTPSPGGSPIGTLSVEDFTLGDVIKSRRFYVDVTSDRPVAVTLSASTSRARRRRATRLASARASLPAAGGKSVSLPLSRRSARVLRAARGQSVVFTAVLKAPDGRSSTLTVRTSAIP